MKNILTKKVFPSVNCGGGKAFYYDIDEVNNLISTLEKELAESEQHRKHLVQQNKEMAAGLISKLKGHQEDTDAKA